MARAGPIATSSRAPLPLHLREPRRLADINGSGTRDVLWANGNKYQYMDLAGGTRPWILTQVDNGLGKSTTLEYSTQHDRDARRREGWQSVGDQDAQRRSTS